MELHREKADHEDDNFDNFDRSLETVRSTSPKASMTATADGNSARDVKLEDTLIKLSWASHRQ